jgi:hypothetical protein
VADCGATRAGGLLLIRIEVAEVHRVTVPGQVHAQVRVALIGCTGLLGDIIGETLAGQPEVDVVAELEPPTGDQALLELDADLVLWNNADESRVVCWLDRLAHGSGPRVLTTMGDGRQASLWELVPRRTELGSLSPRTLVETILGPTRDAGDRP